MRLAMVGFGVVFGFCLSASATICHEVSELVHQAGFGLYDKTVVKQALQNSQNILYATELTEPNIASAQTMVDNLAVSMVILDGTRTERLDINLLVNATRTSPALLVGTFASATDPNLKPKLDAGLQGALLRNPKSADETEAFLNRLFFPPLGHRPLGPALANGYLSQVAVQRERANEVIVGGVVIGDWESAQNIDAIASVKGLNLIYFDYPAILRAAKERGGGRERVLGRLGAAIVRIETTARKYRVPLAVMVDSREEALALAPRGYQVFIVGNDVKSIAQARARFNNVDVQRAKEIPGESVATALKNDRLAILGFLMTPQASYARALHEGANGLWIDAEHGPFSVTQVKEVIAALPAGSFPVVRAAHSAAPEIFGYLAMGAKGIVAPSVETAEQAADFVKRVKTVDPSALAIVMIETKNGATNADAICAVPGIDVIHLGPYDLATSLEVEMGSVWHKAALFEIEEAARRHHVPLGRSADSRETAYALYDHGYRFLTGISDQESITQSLP